MKQKQTPILAGLCAAALLIPAATAADKPTPQQVAEYQKKLFQQVDADADGKLTQKEFVVAALYDIYIRQDLDRSGKLSKAEFVKSFKEDTDVEAEWAMMDADKDGVIEFKDIFKNKNAVSEAEAGFREIDRKKRGYVTLAEVQAGGE